MNENEHYMLNLAMKELERQHEIIDSNSNRITILESTVKVITESIQGLNATVSKTHDTVIAIISFVKFTCGLCTLIMALATIYVGYMAIDQHTIQIGEIGE